MYQGMIREGELDHGVLELIGNEGIAATHAHHWSDDMIETEAVKTLFENDVWCFMQRNLFFSARLVKLFCGLSAADQGV